MYIKDMKERKIINIPQGIYCYNSEDGGLCPYWAIQEDKPHQENGFCHFLNKGDWEFAHNSLIWDGCKECNIFTEINEYNLSIFYPTHKPHYKVINTIRMFWDKLMLWKNIPKTLKFRERFHMIIHGKICRCKFCHKYFLALQDTINKTKCDSCERKE